MSRYKGWKAIRSSYGLRFYHTDYETPIIKNHTGSYFYYYDSPGGQRSRYSFDKLGDAITSLERHRDLKYLNKTVGNASVDYTQNWYRMRNNRWKHAKTELIIIQTNSGFDGYEVHLNNLVVGKANSFLKARLIARDIERGIKIK